MFILLKIVFIYWDTFIERFSLNLFIFFKLIFRFLRDKVSLEVIMVLRSDFILVESIGLDGR